MDYGTLIYLTVYYIYYNCKLCLTALQFNQPNNKLFQMIQNATKSHCIKHFNITMVKVS